MNNEGEGEGEGEGEEYNFNKLNYIREQIWYSY